MKRIVVSILFFFSTSVFAEYNLEDSIAAARTVCYSALPGNSNKSMILVPLPSNLVDLDSVCHIAIDGYWHAGGIAKGRYYHQGCVALDNQLYGGSYTSYVREDYFEANRSNYSNCGPDNAYICCSPQFSN